MAIEHAAGDQRRHRGHLVEREADAVHLDVVREAVDADLRQVDARRAVNAERHVELDGGGVERVEIRVVEVAGLQRGRDLRRHQAEVLRLAHDVDRDLAVLDRRHGDAAQSTVRRPRSSRRSTRCRAARTPRRTRGPRGSAHRVRSSDTAPSCRSGRGRRRRARPRRRVVDAVRRAEPVLAGAAGARALGLGIVTALDDQGPPVGARRDVFGPALHRLDRQRRRPRRRVRRHR